MARAALLLCCCLAALARVQGYAKGAPDESCGDMVPQHGVGPRPPPAPYSLATAPAGGGVTLTLKGRAPFKGFLVQGRDAAGKAVGAFKATPGARTAACSGPGSASGATHSGPEEKSSVTLSWEPKGATGPIVFWYTVAHNGSVFWVGEKTQAVNLN